MTMKREPFHPVARPPSLRCPHRPLVLSRLLLVSLCLLLTASTALAQGTGVVEGRLANGTAGAGPPAGAHVTLYQVQERTMLGELSQQVDSQGDFRFENLDADPSLVYLLVAEYHSILYPYPQLLRLSEQPRQTVEARVYETTQEPNSIAFERANLLVAAVDATQVEIMEMGAVTNTGDRTYVGDERGVLRLHLPSGASEVVAETGLSNDDLQRNGDTLVSLRPIAPGRHQLALRYALPLNGSVLDLSKRLEYPADEVNLYVPYGSLQASSPQLLPQGGAPVEMGGGRFQVYSSQDLPAGTQLLIRLSGLPTRGWELSPEHMAAASLGGAVLLGATAWLLSRYWRARPAAGAPPTNGHESVDPLQLERLTLVREIAQLDERFAAGELGENDYRLIRGECKERLVAVARQLDGAEA